MKGESAFKLEFIGVCVILFYFYKFIGVLEPFFFLQWVSVSLTGKVSDGWIRNLKFNSYLHQKVIGILVWW